MVHLPSPFGVFNVDKPRGVSSRKAVDVVKRLVKPAKTGHAGTLDPLATGVLVVCVGPATKLIPFVQDQSKTYVGTFRLGCTSPTDDLEGEVTEQVVERPPTLDDVRAAIPGFVGEIEQVPPAFSAVHVDGQRAYKIARKGRAVELEPKTVTVHRIDLRRFAYPELELEIDCGSGTYIRSIGRDLGQILGCGAVMTALQRTAVGDFRVENAVPPDELSLDLLASPLTCVADLPRQECPDDVLDRVAHGRPVRIDTDSDLTPGVTVCLTRESELLALADVPLTGQALKPRIVFARPS